MGKDFSRIFYDRYFSLSNRSIEIVLKNGNLIKGEIVGFYKGEENSKEPFITDWHLIDEQEKLRSEIEPLGGVPGITIHQKDIASVKFLEDNSVLKFE